MCNKIYNLYDIEKIFFVGVIIFLLYVITFQPQNIIQFSIYLALYYIPINITMIVLKNKDNIKMDDIEIAHRTFLLLIGLIPIIGLFSKKTNMLIKIDSGIEK